MKKCSVCSKKGWFLRLKNNLCEECNNRLLHLEEESKSIIEKINNKKIEKDEIKEAEEIFRGLKIFSKSGVKINIDINKYLNAIKRYKENIKKKEREKELEEFKKQEMKIQVDNEEEIRKDKEKNEKKNREIIEENMEISEKDRTGILEEIKGDSSVQDKTLCNEEKILIEGNIEIGENGEKKDKIEELAVNDRRMLEMSKILNFKNELATIESEINELKNRIDNKDISIDNLVEKLFKIKDIYLPKIRKISKEGVNSLTLNYEDISRYVEEQIRLLEFITRKSEREIRDSYNYSAICIKTTGDFLSNNSIIEIAAVKVSYGKILKTFQTYIKPDELLQQNIEIETGITNEMLERKPSIRNIMPQFLNFIGSDRLVGYNMGYHSRFIKEEYRKIYGREFFNQELCVMKLYRQKYKEHFGVKAEDSSIEACIENVLGTDPNKVLYAYDSKALSTATAVYKIYEKLKNKF